MRALYKAAVGVPFQGTNLGLGEERALPGPLNTGRRLYHHPKPSLYGGWRWARFVPPEELFATLTLRAARNYGRYSATLRSYSGLGTDSFSKLNCPQGNPVFPGLSFHRAFTPALLHYVSIFKP